MDSSGAALLFAIICGCFIGMQCRSVLPEGHCASCPRKLAKNDPKAWEAAFFVVQQLGPGHVLLDVESAHTEARTENQRNLNDGTISKVVVGQNYYLWLKLHEFQYFYGYQNKHCRATVWEKLDGTKQITVSSC